MTEERQSVYVVRPSHHSSDVTVFSTREVAEEYVERIGTTRSGEVATVSHRFLHKRLSTRQRWKVYIDAYGEVTQILRRPSSLSEEWMTDRCALVIADTAAGALSRHAALRDARAQKEE